MTTDNIISTITALREIYDTPAPDALAVRCVLPHLDRHHRAFIALSPFLIIASANAHGMPEVSPRGDLPGFVAVLDEHTLVIPDRPGNKKIVTLSNIVETPYVALIFFVPGREEALRINGTAQITTDPALLTPLAVQGKEPKSALLVTVAYASLHCGKALTRSRLWESDAQVAPDALPTFGQMLADEIAGVDAATTDARLGNVYKHGLW